MIYLLNIENTIKNDRGRSYRNENLYLEIIMREKAFFKKITYYSLKKQKKKKKKKKKKKNILFFKKQKKKKKKKKKKKIDNQCYLLLAY